MANTLAVSLSLLALISVALTLKRISKGDPEYAHICDGVFNANVPVRDECVMNKYVMCFREEPVFLRFCPTITPHFDPESQQCLRKKEMPLPSRCNRDSSQMDAMPRTCADGAINMANQTTCRMYIACAAGEEIPMYCQNGSYFIIDNCKPYMLHYAESIPTEMLEHCRDLDKRNPLPGFYDFGV